MSIAKDIRKDITIENLHETVHELLNEFHGIVSGEFNHNEHETDTTFNCEYCDFKPKPNFFCE